MKKVFMIISVLFSISAFSHGGDKPGPHDGYIQMPGAFHTEVVAGSQGSFDIYLLDVEFKNPSVKDSEVQAWLTSGKKKHDLSCKVIEESHFNCAPSNKSFKGKELIVKAKREQMQGNEAKYKLPLRR